jgi:hypothetical protein
VVHLLEERDLADSGGGDALILLLETDLLERDRLVGDLVQRLVHHPVRAFPDLLLLLVLHTHAHKRNQNNQIKPSNPNPTRSLAHLLHCVPSATNAVAAAAAERRNKWGGEEEKGFGRMGRGLEGGGEGDAVGKSGSGNGGQSSCCHWERLGLAVSSAAAAAGPRSHCGAIALACCCLLLCAV